MLRRVSTVTTTSLPRRRRRRPSAGFKYTSLCRRVALLRCLALPISKKTLAPQTPVHDWVGDHGAVDGLPLNSSFFTESSEHAERDLSTSKEVCSCSLRLLRAALRRQWTRVDGAVYCRAPSPLGSIQSHELKFHLVSNLDLLSEAEEAFCFENNALYLTDKNAQNDSRGGEIAASLSQHDMVNIPSHSCALFPLLGDHHEIVGLFLLSPPQQGNTASMSTEDMEIIKETQKLLVSALKQYNADQAAQYQKQCTKSILKEGKGAVKSVRSYAKMLSYRPTTGTLEKDMINGIEHQGERISNIVRQLEMVLDGGASLKALPTSSASPPSSYLDN